MMGESPAVLGVPPRREWCIHPQTHVRTRTGYFEKSRREGDWNIVVHTWSYSWRGEGKGQRGLVSILNLWRKRSLELGERVVPGYEWTNVRCRTWSFSLRSPQDYGFPGESLNASFPGNQIRVIRTRDPPLPPAGAKSRVKLTLAVGGFTA